MRIAILLTGAMRTIRKTIRYFRQNLLDCNATHTVDVFICVQNDNPHLESDWDLWFKEQLGNHVQSIQWFTLEKHPHWITHRDILIERMPIETMWKNYLRRSGSMIEYKQLELVTAAMKKYEHVHGEYEYVIRARTDSIFCKPIDFHWLQWTDEEVEARIMALEKSMALVNITTEKLVPYFMNTLLSDQLIENVSLIHATQYPSDADRLLQEIDKQYIHSTVLNEYLKRGRYILTFRKNNLYIVRRDLFHLIPGLATMYGQFKSPYSDPWWFNAEGQFTSICYHIGLTTYDYNTNADDRSVEVHGWDTRMFFDEEMNVVNPMMVYCVVRR